MHTHSGTVAALMCLSVATMQLLLSADYLVNHKHQIKNSYANIFITVNNETYRLLLIFL